MLARLNMREEHLKTTKRIKIFPSTSNNAQELDLEKLFERTSCPIHPNCRILDMNITAVPKMISISLFNTKKFSFQMDIIEKNMALANRRIDSYAYNGPSLKLEKLESKGLNIGLRLKQSFYSDQDKAANCIQYPSKEFRSFQDCDEYFISNEMKKVGIMPFWAVNNHMYNNMTRSK